jgi:hypothetical protein
VFDVKIWRFMGLVKWSGEGLKEVPEAEAPGFVWGFEIFVETEGVWLRRFFCGGQFWEVLGN